MPTAGIAGLLMVGLVFAFYTWTAATSTDLGLHQHRVDPYNEQATAFLHGHTALPIDVPQGLLALPDPWDPYANYQYRAQGIYDLILHDGKLYSYWGPAPVVLLYIPFRALGLGDLPPGIAVLVFSFVGLLLSLSIMRFVVRLWLPETPPWMLGVGAGVLALCNVAPWMLRDPLQYEVAITGAFCFAQAGVLLILTGALRDQPDWRRLAFGSLCCGLAFDTRPPLGVAIVAAVIVLGWWHRTGRLESGPPRRRALAILLGPCALCVAAFGAYNAVRFGSPGNFGTGELLQGVNTKQYPLFALRFLGPGLWEYLIAPVRWNVQFPFVQLTPPPGPPFSLPHRYVTPEPTMGVLTSLPVLWFLAAGPWALRGTARALRVVVWGLAATGAALLVLVAVTFWLTTERYEMDFMTFLLLPACLVWFAAMQRVRDSVRPRRLIAVGGTVLAVYGAIVAVGASLTGPSDTLRYYHPGTYSALESFFEPVAIAMAKLAGHPVIANIEGNARVGSARYDQLGVDGASASVSTAGPLHFDVIAPSDETIVVRARMSAASGAAVAPLLTLGSATVPGHEVDGGEQELAVPGHRGRNSLTLQLIGRDQAQVAVQDLRVGDH